MYVQATASIRDFNMIIAPFPLHGRHLALYLLLKVQRRGRHDGRPLALNSLSSRYLPRAESCLCQPLVSLMANAARHLIGLDAHVGACRFAGQRVPDQLRRSRRSIRDIDPVVARATNKDAVQKRAGRCSAGAGVSHTSPNRHHGGNGQCRVRFNVVVREVHRVEGGVGCACRISGTGLPIPACFREKIFLLGRAGNEDLAP